ncbi:hypothetical protein D3C76_662680 [compost metagenome]
MSAIVTAAIRTALTEHLPSRMDTVSARLIMLAIQKQEDPEERRYQVVKRTEATAQENIVGPKTAKGPARGLWQFEVGGGIVGVLQHEKTGPYIIDILNHFDVQASANRCKHAIEQNDVLAACFARLLLWADPKPLPKITDAEGAFDCYLRQWRPGAFTRGTDAQQAALEQKFLRNHAAARQELNIQ